MKQSRIAISVAIIMALAMVIYPDVVFSEEETRDVTFIGDDATRQPVFTLYVLHEGRPYKVEAPQEGDKPWPTLKLYQYDSVTLISTKPDTSCTNRIIRFLPDDKGVEWQIPFRNVNGCETIEWENKEPIKVPVDF